MKILVIGGGGREHAICYSFRRSPAVSEIFCANGNAGISQIAKTVAIRSDQIFELEAFAREKAINLTFVGGETSLALGIVDRFRSAGLKIIGPGHAAARLESSKAFAKDFMLRHQIPTARFSLAGSPAEAVSILQSGFFGPAETPVVVKADGLAAGKGVVVAPDRSSAIAAVESLADIAGNAAAERIVLEDYLEGREVSLLLFASGDKYALMPPTRDYKRLLDGDLGPNTGGMGTFTDDLLLTEGDTETIRRYIIEPTLAGCIAEGFPFSGILFLGLMMTKDGPKVLEYNVRFGDPETQSILVRLESDLLDICLAISENRLDSKHIHWRKGSSATVILASEGYPRSPRLGDPIYGLAEAESVENVTLFHSGTAIGKDGQLVTAGGRVLGVTAIGPDRKGAIETAYKAAKIIKWQGIQYRSDIGS